MSKYANNQKKRKEVWRKREKVHICTYEKNYGKKEPTKDVFGLFCGGRLCSDALPFFNISSIFCVCLCVNVASDVIVVVADIQFYVY